MRIVRSQIYRGKKETQHLGADAVGGVGVGVGRGQGPGQGQGQGRGNDLVLALAWQGYHALFGVHAPRLPDFLTSQETGPRPQAPSSQNPEHQQSSKCEMLAKPSQATPAVCIAKRQGSVEISPGPWSAVAIQTLTHAHTQHPNRCTYLLLTYLLHLPTYFTYLLPT